MHGIYAILPSVWKDGGMTLDLLLFPTATHYVTMNATGEGCEFRVWVSNTTDSFGILYN